MLELMLLALVGIGYLIIRLISLLMAYWPYMLIAFCLFTVLRVYVATQHREWWNRYGFLPRLFPQGFVSQTGEDCYYAHSSRCFESTSIRRKRSVSVGLIKMGAQHLGGWAGVRESEARSINQLKPVGRGTLVITNRQVVFLSRAKVVRVAHHEILSWSWRKRRLAIACANSTYEFLFPARPSINAQHRLTTILP